MKTFYHIKLQFFICIVFLFISQQSTYSQQLIRDSIVHNGTYRYYNLYIPAAYTSGQSVPLLFNFHGYGQTASAQNQYANFMPMADSTNFILILPEGTLLSGISHWNVGLLVSQVDDIDFVLKLIDSISATYTINQNRIYATGFSNGAYLSQLLASRTNKFAAIASVSGSITPVNFASLSPEHPVSVMMINGTSDFIVPYTGLANSKPIEDVINYWVGYNNCNPTPNVFAIPDTNLSDAANAQKFSYLSGNNGSKVVLIKVNNGGHTWPGSAYIAGITCMDFSASTEIWNFLKDFSLSTNTNNYQPQNEDVISYNSINRSIEISNLIEKDFNLEIISATGNKIFEIKNQFSIHINNLSNGIYIIRLYTKDKVYCKKIITNVR